MSILSKINNINKDVIVETPNDPALIEDTPPAVDSVIETFITLDNLKACINIAPPCNGGLPPTLEAMESALAKFGISYNVDREKLEELSVEPIYNQDIVIARGIAPVNGENGTASFLIETEKRTVKPKENADGIVNYHDLGIVENVYKNQVLCTITFPTEGTPGVSVKGKELSQKKGQPVPNYLGSNTELNEDGTAIIARIDGQVEFIGSKINVNETFYVKENVDNSTGDIKVANSLIVRGMVLPGFKIEAGRNISVYGTVEASKIKAGGNVTLQSGINGSDVYCEGDLKSRFIENCNVFVKGEIQAEYILNSEIICGKNLKTVGTRAKIIGGSCMVGQNIEVQTIGSEANVKTRLELGTDPTIIERQQELKAQIPELEKQIETLKPLISLLHQLEENNRLTPEKEQILENARYSYETNTKKLEDAKKELEEIAQSIKDRGYGRVVCTGSIYPGTKIVMGAEILSVSDTLNNTLLYFDEGTICRGTAR